MGALSGLVGALAHLNRRIFFTEALTHVTFPGAILGVVLAQFLAPVILGHAASHEQLSLALFLGSLLMCLPLMALMNFLAKIPGQSAQSSAGIILTLGFALGYFLNRWFSPLPLNIKTFLTGSVINVNATDVLAVGIVLLLTVVLLGLFRRYLVFYSFDRLGYRGVGYSSSGAEIIILSLIAMTIVVLIPAVGTILPIALIAAPAASLYPFMRSVGALLLLAPILGTLICLAGFIVALVLNLSVGGVIAVLAGIVYLLSWPLRRILA